MFQARIALAEQLSKSRELTVKIAKDKDSESEKEDEEVVEPEPAEEDPNNPWVVKRSKEMEEFVSGYRKYWETKGKDSNKTHDTAVKVSDYSSDILEDNECVEQDTLNQTSNQNSKNKQQRQFNAVANETSDCVASHSANENSYCGKNVFTVNTSTKKTSQLKTNNNKSLTMFEITTSPVKRGIKSNNASFSTELNESKTNVKNINGPKSECKSGAWTILEASSGNKSDVPNAKSSKKIQVVKSKTTKTVQNLNKSFQVTDSNHVKVKTNLPSNHNNNVEEIKFKDTETRVHKNKSLDELFEEAEDKLHSKIKAKMGKIKQTLDRKRIKSSENISESETEEMPSLEIKRSKIVADMDEELIENTQDSVRAKSDTSILSKTLLTASAEPKPTENIDPNKYLKVTPRKIISKVPEIMTEGDDALDDEETTDNDRHLTISEAFAEDDVVDQFQ